MQSPPRYVEYDCSAKSNYQTSSWNDCLKIGPPLQPLIFDIILRCLIKNVSSRTLKNVFLQIRLVERNRDSQRLFGAKTSREKN